MLLAMHSTITVQDSVMVNAIYDSEVDVLLPGVAVNLGFVCSWRDSWCDL